MGTGVRNQNHKYIVNLFFDFPNIDCYSKQYIILFNIFHVEKLKFWMWQWQRWRATSSTLWQREWCLCEHCDKMGEPRWRICCHGVNESLEKFPDANTRYGIVSKIGQLWTASINTELVSLLLPQIMIKGCPPYWKLHFIVSGGNNFTIYFHSKSSKPILETNVQSISSWEIRS